VARARITVDLENCQELIRRLRWFMSSLLREVADGEADPRVAARLREVADAFEKDEELK
jgi:hypothetical protein